MTTILNGAVQASVLAAVLFWAGFGNRNSLFVAAVALATIFAWKFLARQHRLSLDDEDSDKLDDEGQVTPHPLTLLVTGVAKGAFLLVLLIPFFGAARMLTIYRMPWENQDQATAHTVKKHAASDSPSTNLDFKVVDYEFVKQVHFVEALALSSPGDMTTAFATAPLDGFQVSINGITQPLISVARIEWNSPLAVTILRDVTPSIMVSQPFPDILRDATQDLVAALDTDPRRTMMRVVDFAGGSVEVCAWTDDYKHIGPLPLGTPATPTSSDIVNNMVEVIEDLATKQETDRVLVTITDFANNVPSQFNANGLGALAQKNSVALVFIYLRTKDFKPAYIEILKMLAEQTGGTCIDGADPGLALAIKKMVRSTSHPLPAYRVTFAGDKAIGLESISIKGYVPAVEVANILSLEGAQ